MTRLSSSGVYAITNTVNGKQYIGSAINFSNRWKNHRFHLNRGTHHNTHLMRAWKRYGSSAFTFTILEVVSDRAHLLVREQHHLDLLKPAYNECLIAGSKLGLPQSAKHRTAMVEFNKRQVFTPERLARMSEITRRRLSDPTVRETQGILISKGLRAYHAANPGINKQRAAHLRNKPRPAEVRAKISAARRGQKLGPMSAEARANISASLKGKPHSAESEAKRRISQKATWDRKRAERVKGVG